MQERVPDDDALDGGRAGANTHRQEHFGLMDELKIDQLQLHSRVVFGFDVG